MVQAKMADMYVKLNTARSYTYNVAKAMDNGLCPSKVSPCLITCNTNRSSHDNVYRAVVMALPLREFTRFIWPPTFRPSQSAWATNLSKLAATVLNLSLTFIALRPKAATHFTIPRRVEGWVDLAGWLNTEMVTCPESPI